MMRGRTDRSMLSFFYTPLCILLLIFCLFELIWLRSGLVTVAYDVRTLEEKRMEALKETKTLLAARANLMSLEKLEGSFRKNGQDEKTYASGGYVFPDRLKVVYIKKGRGAEPLKAALEMGSRN